MQDRIFVDTAFVVALINKNDQYHGQALVLSEKYENVPLITTDVVLLEIGNALAKNYKQEAIKIIQTFCSSDEITIVRLNSMLFKKAFVVMWENDITDVLTFDKHFEQAGFNALKG